MNRLLIIVLVLSFISACSLAPKYIKPEMELPQSLSGDNKTDNMSIANWWEGFDDPVLNQLVLEAIEYNFDVRVAYERVWQAKAALGVAMSNQFPMINASADLTQSWLRGKEVSGFTPDFTAGFNASWEIDLFGKYRNRKDAAYAQLLTAEAAKDGVKLSVAGETAKGYFLLKSLNMQLSVAERTVNTRLASVNLYEERYRLGLISLLNLTQMRTSLETAKNILYQTKASLDEANAALIMLVGRSPSAIMNDNITKGERLEFLEAKPFIPEGVSSERLLRRPDIRQAEEALRAANFDIGVAKSAYFPTISLTGMFGAVSNELDKLFVNPSLAWNYGASLTLPILNFGNISSNVDMSYAKKREAIINYEKSVQNAFFDLRKSLKNQEEFANIADSLYLMQSELKKAYELAQLQYEQGYSSYLDLLDTERSLLQVELDLASARSNYLSSIVNVYLALGGGW